MQAAYIVLELLLCVAAAAILARMFRLPLPLVQVALGAAASLPSFGLQLELEPHLFLLLFVPPLLFADGWRIPKREFFEMRERILALALGLVLFTVLAVGSLLQWLIPGMAPAAAFALAAVLSPTDAVAVSALAGRAGIPKRLMYVLEGEALMNDASGLTAFKFAIAAAVTGAFSLSQASMAFVFVALGGLAVGIVLGLAMAVFQKWLSGFTEVEAQGTIVLILLLPFAAYLGAEKLGASGILAAVAAGMTLNLRSAALNPGAEARIASTHIWAMIQYVLNGSIFVLLGLQLPDIIGKALEESFEEGGFADATRLLGYALITALALIAARLVWVWAMLRTSRLLSRDVDFADLRMPRGRLLMAMALAGVRGAITLAAVLSVPLMLDDGSAFPQRNLMIFIAASVILFSLLAAAIGLPLLLRGMKLEGGREEREERFARLRACEAAIAAIASAVSRDAREGAATGSSVANAETASRIIDRYQQRIEGLSDGEHQDADQRNAQDQALRLIGVCAEREELRRLHRDNAINDTVFNTLLYELDIRESSLAPVSRAHG